MSDMALPFPDNSSRNRSVSVGDSGLPQHEHKRPRLSELDTGTGVTSSGATQPLPADISIQTHTANAPSLQTPPASPGQFVSPSKAMSPRSKVTINTRPLSSQSSHLPEPAVANTADVSKSNDVNVTTSNSESPVVLNLSDGESSKQTSGEANEPISISSSPSGSPVIEVGAPEDVDENPANTDWLPLPKVDSTETGYANLRNVLRSFPFVDHFDHAPKVIADMTRKLEMGSSQDANIIAQLTSWFNDFITNSANSSYLIVEEEHEVWQQIPRLVVSLLKRRTDLDEEIDQQDLVNFFISYSQLTIRMARFDLERLRQYSDKIDPKLVKPPYFFEYLRHLATFFHSWGSTTLCAVLHASQRINAKSFLQQVVDYVLQHGAQELFVTLSGTLQHLMRLLPNNSRLLAIMLHTLQHSSNILQAFGPRISAFDELGDVLRESLTSYALNANECLDHAIKKQQSWLTIETSQHVLVNYWVLTQTIVYFFPEFFDKVIHDAGVKGVSFPKEDFNDVAWHAYRFTILFKYIRHGRMELRVYGIENMAQCLVDVWTRLQHVSDSNNNSLVRFAVAFLQQNDMVNYILGVDSHPQIVQRSCNVVGFLCISCNWQSTDTDAALHAILDSEDPRAGSAVCEVLKSNVSHLNAESVHYMYLKLLELPFGRFDSRIFGLTMAVLHIGAQKFPPPRSNEPLLHFAIVKLCLRLLRDASSPAYCGHGLAEQIRFEIHRYLLNEHRRCCRNLLDVMPEAEKERTLKTLCNDIAEHSDLATGSVFAMNLLLTTLDHNESVAIVQECNYTKLLIEDIARDPSFRDVGDIEALQRSLLAFYEIRFTGLASLVIGMPDSFNESLIEALWSEILSSNLPQWVRSMAWNSLANSFQKCRFHNHVLDSLITDYFQLLPSSSFDKAVLQFIEQSVEYEMRLSPSELMDPDAAIEIPGIERVWKIMLEAAPNTVEVDASDFIIRQYLDGDAITSRSYASIDATHSALIDRCVRTVIESAHTLNALYEIDNKEMIESSPSSSLEIVANELRFQRSIVLLRKFLTGLKSRPRYKAVTLSSIQSVLDTFELKGPKLELSLIVNAHPTISAARHTWVVGEDNSGAELFQFLAEVTGWTQMNFIKGGERFALQNKSSLLREITFGPGPVVLSKAYGIQDGTPTRAIRASSPVDTKVMHHFEDLYGLLDASDKIAKQVYDFLTLFTSQESILQHIASMSLSAEDLIPVERPFRLLYYTRALRSCIEDESLSSSPNTNLISYAVHQIVASLQRVEAIQAEPAVRTSIFHGLTEALLLALRAKVPREISSLYFDDHETFVEQIMKLWHSAYDAAASNITQLTPSVLTRTPFEVFIEASLHDPRLWQYIRPESSFSQLLAEGILLEPRLEIRKSFVDIFCRLTGTQIGKLPKQPDDRSPQARFPLEHIETCLSNLWNTVKALLPLASKRQELCQQYFESASMILKTIGTKITAGDLQSLFEQLQTLLLHHSYQQDIGQEPKDHLVWGLATLLHQCHSCFPQDETIYFDNPELVGQLFTQFLFPPLSSDDRLSTDPEAIPVLDPHTRGALYDLVIALCKDVECLRKVVSEVDGDLIDLDAFNISLANERKSLRSNVGYSGLRNLSNTCYLNSLFSQLFMNVKFREFIIGVHVVDKAKQRLVSELADVFANMQSSYEKYVTPEDAVESITQYDGEQIDVTIQMDVDEFFNLLFDRLETQIFDQESRTIFKSMYGGQLVQQIKSKECEHVSERIEPFSAVQIEIRGKTGLEEGLAAYVEGEVLQGENKYSCTGCGRHVDAVKRACLKELPDNLIFNLKRFDYDIMTGTRCKINDEFQFPDTIDMAPFTINALSQPSQSIPPDHFELVGVIIHSGTAETGHYYSYIRQRPSASHKEQSWVQFNDQDVTKFDPSMLADSAFGGVDSTFNNMSKFYNGYMLFYQRSSSIQQYEQHFPAPDPVNPVEVPLTERLSRGVALSNELCLRTFVVQDPVHAKFIRQLAERIRTDNNGCSETHDLEHHILKITLDYLQCVSSRWREVPELEDTVKVLVTQSQHCEKCALFIVNWYAKDSNAIINLVRLFYTTARKAFATLLCGAFSGLHTVRSVCAAQHNLPENRRKAEVIDHAVSDCIEKLHKGWDFLQRNSRAWDSYFGVLSHVVRLGDTEASIVIDTGFFERALELLWIHVPGQLNYFKPLRQRYSFYLAAREKNRAYGHTHLLEFFATVLPEMELDDKSKKPASFNSTPRMIVSEDEAELLCLRNPARKISWLTQLILGQSNPLAAILIIKELCNYQDHLPKVARALKDGLEDANSIFNAVLFLDPTIAFLKYCSDEAVARELATQALESIDTTQGNYAHDFFGFVRAMVLLSRELPGEDVNFLEDTVLENMKRWVPVLIMAQNDMQHDVRNDVLGFLNEILFANLPDQRAGSPLSADNGQRIVRSLTVSCMKHIQNNYLDPHPRERALLQAGQAMQVISLLNICKTYYDPSNVADESFLAGLESVIESLEVLAQNTSQTLEDWREPSSDLEQMSDLESLEFEG